MKRFKVGDRVGRGLHGRLLPHLPAPASSDLEQFCEKGAAFTYNGTEMDRKTPTYGGYSTEVVVDEKFVLSIPAGLDPAGAAPLLCAGITTYSPLRHWKVKKGDQVGVVGLGGLGHMAVKLAAAMGAEVTMLSHLEVQGGRRPPPRRHRLRAHLRRRPPSRSSPGRFDFILDTISAPHDYNAYLGHAQARRGDGAGGRPLRAGPGPRHHLHLRTARRLAGSLIGGIAETQEMLDFCGKHGITRDVEVIPVEKVNEAYERTVKVGRALSLRHRHRQPEEGPRMDVA